jgi:hypothetical protein
MAKRTYGNLTFNAGTRGRSVQKMVYVVRYTYQGEGYCLARDFDTRREAIGAANAMVADKWQGVFVEKRTANIPA